MRQLADKERPRLEKIFGPMEPWDVRKFLFVEQEREQCRDCHGLPCKKVSGTPEQNPVIFRNADNHRSIGYKPCRYKIAADFQNSLARRLHGSKIPERYVGKTFDDYEVDDLNRDAVNYAKSALSTGRGAFLFGQRGTGKTFLAAIIAQSFMQDFRRVVFGDVPSLMELIKQSFDSDAQNPLEDFCNCDLLILDDIGAGQITEWNVGQLYQIINARYNAELPVIITSNLDFDGLKKNFGNSTGDRIISRLSEICTLAFLGTNDRRKSS